ncbi:MAG TPA: acyl-CoA dehydrogenase family protein [Planctomycetota bacterium]|nr:acyl-CoA dehydrogenase family protein [Planctomycetota bacterium]
MSDAASLMRDLTARAKRAGETAEPLLEGLGEDDGARQALRILAEAGLLAWTVPASCGGADPRGAAPPDDLCVRALCALRAACAYHYGLLDLMLAMQGLGSHALARAGSPALRAEILPRVAAGDSIAAFALTEPDAGSDLGRIATRAERSASGWTLSGHKTLISNAGIADFYTLLARTSGSPADGGRGALTLFFLPATASGLTVHRFEVSAPHPIGELHLSNVEVPDAQRLGEIGSGLDLALATLARFRATVAAAATGFARRALDESLRHLRSREQFGRPLSTFQALRFDLAEMDVELRAAELLTAEAAETVDRGEPATAQVARAKLFATEAASRICDRAIQHQGGLGVRRGVVVERLWREARALRIYEGTSEVQKLILAREILSD